MEPMHRCHGNETRKFTHGRQGICGADPEGDGVAFGELGVSADPFLVLISEPRGIPAKSNFDWVHLVDQHLVRSELSRDEDL